LQSLSNFFKSDDANIYVGITLSMFVPFNVAFRSKTMDDVPLLVADSIVDVVCFLDIVLNFHTTYVSNTGEVISASFATTYLKSCFVIDLLSCLPYDTFNPFQDAQDVRSFTFFLSFPINHLKF
jgi:hypothetical protein